jgi:hypothetical protein
MFSSLVDRASSCLASPPLCVLTQTKCNAVTSRATYGGHVIDTELTGSPTPLNNAMRLGSSEH